VPVVALFVWFGIRRLQKKVKRKVP
jgi:hypothetical protein